jgi:trigger factor
MKKIISFLLLAVLLVSLASCGGAKPLDLAKTDLSEYVTLGDYLGITVEVEAPKEVTDEDVQAVVDELLEKNAVNNTEEITDRPVAEGDTVNIDYTGYIDNVAFEGGSANNQDLVIGSNSYIEGFETGLIGAESGSTVEVTAQFPDSYDKEDLAGKTARFEVKVNSISVVTSVKPEYTDDFVKENTDFQTIALYEANIRKDIEDNRAELYENAKTSAVWYTILDNASFAKLPAQNVEYEIEQININIDLTKRYYMQYFGLDEATVNSLITTSEEDIKASAEDAVREELVFHAIVKAENYSISDAEYDEAIAKYAENRSATAAELEANYGKETLTEAFLWDKVLNTLTASANIVNK